VATGSGVQSEFLMTIHSGKLFSALSGWLGTAVGEFKKTNHGSKAKSAWLGASGDWSDPANWSANSVPGPSDLASIDGAASYTVTVDAPQTIGSAGLDNSGATLDIQSEGVLTVKRSLDVRSGVVQINGDGLGAPPGGTLKIGKSLFVRPGGSLVLNGGTIEGGSLVIAQGGVLEVTPSLPVPGGGGVLENVTVVGGLNLDAGTLWLSGDTKIENARKTDPGTIAVDGPSAFLGLAENYTFDDLTLEGGFVAGAFNAGVHATVETGGLVQGYGDFISDLEGSNHGSDGILSFDNEGTINSNVNGQLLNIIQIPFENDGLVLASGGGDISIDYPDPYSDQWSNRADGVISAINGGTLRLGGDVTNFGLISAVDSTVNFGDPNGSPDSADNAGDMLILGGTLFLGAQNGESDTWVNSGLIVTVDAAVDVQGSGTISAGGILSVLGGTVSGQTAIEDDGQIRLDGGSIALSSLSLDTGGQLSGFGVVADPIANSGIIDASIGKLNLEDAITGNGHLHIGMGATLELGGATRDEVMFQALHGRLLLDEADDFSGKIAGMRHGDTVDLADFAFKDHPTITKVASSGAAGSITDVTVSDGSLTTTLHLLNHSASQFPVDSSAYTLVSDHNGSTHAGTLFSLSPPSVAHFS